MSQNHYRDTILIVDDNLINLQVLFSTLKQRGYKVIPAQDADSTFLRLKHQIPDLILLDVMMPKTDGFELYRRIREHPPTATTPIIFISALDNNEAIVRGLKLGAVDYITKPFRAEEVLARVSRQLEISHMQRVLQEELEQRNRLEISLRQAKEQAEAASLAKSAFLANMSHELRTPLNAVLGYAQILQHDSNLDETQRHSVLSIRRSGEYLLTLINDVLDLAKVETGHLELFPNNFDLGRFFAELSNLFSMRAVDKGLHFYYRVAPGLPSEVNADEKRLRQICMNLLSNAMKFTERGTIRLEVEYQDGTIIIEVIDTGIGIPSALCGQLFKPFMQIGEDRYKQQGTGLGLAISYNLIQLMGGTIELTSAEGIGSCFTVQVPISVVSLASTEQAMERLESVLGIWRTDESTEPFQVLIVDDIADNRAVLSGLLKPLGFTITEATDGVEAVTLTMERTFDLIFMDLVMPNMDGLTATQRILETPGIKNQTIISLSARAFAEDRIASLDAGCKYHLVKPVERNELLRVLRLYLPLKWQYTQDPPATTAIVVPNQQLSTTHITALLDLLQRGAVHDIVQYLKHLMELPDCPSQATVLLELTQNFRLTDLQHVLESTADSQ